MMTTRWRSTVTPCPARISTSSTQTCFLLMGLSICLEWRELIGALRQLNVESKDIVSHPIKAAYESAVPRTGPLHHNEKAIPKAAKPKPKPQPKSKRRSTSPFEIEETVPPKHATRSTTKYNMPRKRLSLRPNNPAQDSTFPRILYVY